MGKVHSARLEDAPQAGGSVPGPEDLGGYKGLFQSSARVGWHGRWLGIDAGPAILVDLQPNRPDEPQLLPSMTGWIGVPRYAYGWLDFVAGPTGHATGPFGAGLGHIDGQGRYRLEAGIASGSGFRADGAVWVHGLWLGLGLRSEGGSEDNDGWTLLGQASFQPGNDD